MTTRYSVCFFLLVLLISCLSVRTLHAQPTSARGWYEREDIENVDIGWIKTLPFKEPAKPFVQHGWSYTAKQMEHTQKLTTWLQQTYLPKGYLGEALPTVLAPPPAYPVSSASYDYNEAEKNNRNALPNTYGVHAKLYMLLMKTADKKFWPINGMANFDSWHIMANNVELISQQMIYLSSPDEYYCTIPQYSMGMKGNFETAQNETFAKYRNFNNSANLQPYEHYLVPSKVVDPGWAKYVVILTKDRKPLPFEQVTVGAFIARLESRLPMMHTITVNTRIRVENLLERAKKGLQLLKEKYKNQLNDFVYLSEWNFQPDIQCLAAIEPNKDVYWLKTKAANEEKGYVSAAHALLRLKKGVKEACAKGDPQWIVCRMEKDIAASNAGEVHKMETFMERFNYAYLYDYFFGPDKVIQPYKPLTFAGAPSANTSTLLPPSAETSTKVADKSIIFFEDFSAVAIGATPTNWTTQRSDASGDKVAIVEVAGVSGRWLKLKRSATPKGVSFPVSGDLEFSFDLLVQKGDVPWGTPGMKVALVFSSPQGDKRFSFDNLSPGDMNRAGAAGWTELYFGASSCKFSNYYSLPDFTGSKPTNKVTITVRKKGESVTVLSNNNKVYECPTAFTAGQELKALSFEVNEKNVFYLSNVQLKKL